MERLLDRIKGNVALLTSVRDCEIEITPILQKFITNFPDYTDHSIIHSKSVLGYAAYLLDTEIEKLNEDEVYVLIIAGYLHDIGMCPAKEMKKEIINSPSFKDSEKSFEEYLRFIHHELSYSYIISHWKDLRIINERYAEAIALVARGHRVVDLFDLTQYQPDFAVKSGNEFVCLPFLSSILRLADELDITNDRTPELLYNEYYPDNKISKQEWDKHKANYVVNFKKDTIKITSKCHKQELYYALIKQYKKIDSVINYNQKLIRVMPYNERELQLNFTKLERDIKTVGFLPKAIGFSFDLQNTIDTFIGDNIYENKSVAIRECLQNSIDSCRYRRLLAKANYKPKINISLSEKELIVTDNGLGMDEFIVENYFAKLAKSYYKENRVSKEFEAISQFGVGVFSYFLICDYFDVESKLEGKETVRFRVKNDADSYFRFYDQHDRKSTGTSITFYLRDELTLDELIEQVNHYIRFVEFPISIKYKNRHEKIRAQDFRLDKEKELKKKITRAKSDNLAKLEIIDSKIDNEEYEGILGIIMTKDNKGNYIPKSLFSTFKSYRDLNIELSHKGIYVNKVHDFFLDCVIGKLNIKRKKDIDIGRYNIKNGEYLNSIISDFQYRFLTKLFDNWQPKRKKTKVRLTRSFLLNYVNYYYGKLDERVFSLCAEHFYFSVYHKSVIKQYSLNELNSLKEVVILNDNRPFTRGHKYEFEDIQKQYDYFKKPLLLENDYDIARRILFLFKFQQRAIEIVSSSQHWHFLIKEQQSCSTDVYPVLLDSKKDVYIFDKPYIAAYPKIDTSTPYNLKHKMIESFILNSNKILADQTLNDLCNEFLELLHNFMFDYHVGGIKKPTGRIVLMNNVLTEINKKLLTNFKLSSVDFPKWISEKIKWVKTRVAKT